MHTEEEAKRKWCPFSRPVFPRVEDCGYQTGNRNSVGPGESQITEQSQCIGSACMAWRWEGRDDGEVIATDRGHIPKSNARGYCGLAGRPEAS